MNSHIIDTASQRLHADGGGFRKLVWLHSAVPVLVSVVLLLLTALSDRIAPEGGLSNMDTHTMITTVLTVLQLTAMVGVLFWNAGLEYTALSFLRGRSIGVGSLTEGFSRFGALMISWIFRWGNYLLLIMVSGTATSLLFAFLPLPQFLYEDFGAFLSAPALPMKPTVLFMTILYFLLYFTVLAGILVPRFYQHRLTGYFIMEDTPSGGLQAVLQSTGLMRGNRWKLAKLDLRFWWFYLGELAVTGISMGQLFFPDVPGGSWLFPVISMAAQLGLYFLAKPKLAACYALFYESLTSQPPAEEPAAAD